MTTNTDERSQGDSQNDMISPKHVDQLTAEDRKKRANMHDDDQEYERDPARISEFDTPEARERKLRLRQGVTKPEGVRKDAPGDLGI